MPSILDLQTAGQIQFEVGRDAFRIYSGIGGGRIEVSMRITRQDERKDVVPCDIAARMSVGTHPNVGQRYLCDLRTEHLVSPASHATQANLTGFITDQQFRIIEEIRHSRSLWISLELTMTCVDGEPPRLIRGWGTENFDIQSGEWAEALERVDAGSYVELLVPLPSNKQLANAVRRLRKARELMRSDQVEEALGETRKAVERVRKAYRTWKLAAGAAKKDARLHTKQERWAIYIESVFSLLSAEIHDDEGTTENFVWTQAEADALILSVAGMLARLAEDERNYMT
jgi:hypothetical protein